MAAILHVLVAALVGDIAKCSRMMSDADALDGDTGKDGGAANASLLADGLPLRIFASTFNAGNMQTKKYEGGFASLAESLMAGHDEPDKEADLVFLGFQEMQDNDDWFAARMRKSLLWARSTKSQLQTLRKSLADSAAMPKHIVDAKLDLVHQLKSFHDTANEAVAHVLNNYGPSSSWRADVAAKSPVTQLKKEAEKMLGSVDTEPGTNVLGDIQRRQREATPDARFEPLKDALHEVLATAEKAPGHAELGASFETVKNWGRELEGEVKKHGQNFPNLAFSTGNWDGYVKSFNSLGSWMQHLEDEAASQKARLKVTSAKYLSETQAHVWEKEAEIAQAISEDWQRLRDALGTLSMDLASQERQLRRTLEKLEPPGLQPVADSWASSTLSHAKDLLGRSPPELEEDQVVIPLTQVTYDSGKLCHAGSHYNTLMYVYVNPWSAWKFTPVRYSSARCTESSKEKIEGCTLDFNVVRMGRKECGKVVNLAVLDATRGAAKTRVCLMNTHMSFAGHASDRAKTIVAAMSEASQARCDSVVFVGDFNSRLHCDSRPGATLPLFEDAGNAASSFMNIINRFCVKQGSALNCGLAGHEDQYDELRQLLADKGSQCFEKVDDDESQEKKSRG